MVEIIEDAVVMVVAEAAVAEAGREAVTEVVVVVVVVAAAAAAVAASVDGIAAVVPAVVMIQFNKSLLSPGRNSFVTPQINTK